MSFYEKRVLPHLIDLLLGNRGMARVRRRSLEGLSGTVVELGFGSGTNLGLYPDEVERILAIEPNLTARRLSAKRRAAHPRPPVEFVGFDGQSIPLPDASADAVLSTFTLCTIPDVGAALAESRRVLRPNGRLFVLEHGLADDRSAARWQHRLDPLQGHVGGGCHLTRDITAIVQDAGFEFERHFTFVLGSRVYSSMTTGVARVAA